MWAKNSGTVLRSTGSTAYKWMLWSSSDQFFWSAWISSLSIVSTASKESSNRSRVRKRVPFRHWLPVRSEWGVDMQATCVCATSVCQIGNICFLITPDGGNLPSWGYRETKRVIETRTVTTAIRNGSCMLIEENSQEFCIFCI
jgi:hypothetical protein